MDFTITVYILDDSPPILSVGRLCRMHGFIFVQNGAQDPVLYDNKFTQGTTLRIRNDAPFMLPELTNEPLITTPVNSPRKSYDAKTAKQEMDDTIQAKLKQAAEKIEITHRKEALPELAKEETLEKVPEAAKAKPKKKQYRN